MTLAELMAKHPDKTANEIAILAMRQAKPECIQIVSERVDHIRRAAVRTVEANLIGPLLDRNTPVPIGSPTAQAALRKTFATGSGGAPVEWGRATVADHRARIQFLRKHIAGCERTITFHETAIESIESAGVACLDELEDVA